MKQKKIDQLIIDWILEGKKLKHLAKEFGFHLQSIQQIIHSRLKTFQVTAHDNAVDPSKPLILDATWVVWRNLIVLIAHNGDRVIDWMFAPRENFFVWNMFLAKLKGQPLVVVSDAQKGLLQALWVRFGSIHHQRCIAHITRQSRIWLTQHPKTDAGAGLLSLVNTLHKIKTHSEKEVWDKLFDDWLHNHEIFLKERTLGTGKRWWYTHRRLRWAKSLLLRARKEMFTYLDHQLPSTTNHLEGGINGPLKFMFKEHRGLSMEHKKQAVNLFLSARARKKNQH